MVENPIELSEREQRAATGESQIDGRLTGLPGLGEVLVDGQRSVEMLDGLAVGRTPSRLRPCLAQVGESLLPRLASDRMMGQSLDLLDQPVRDRKSTRLNSSHLV